MIREAILEAMNLRRLKLRDVAKRANVDAGNLSRFLAGRGSLGVVKIERVMLAVGIELDAQPEWLRKVNRCFPELRRRLPDIPQEDIRLILVSLVQPIDWKSFFLKRLPEGGYAF